MLTFKFNKNNNNMLTFKFKFNKKCWQRWHENVDGSD